jgi:archaellum component FlaC
LVKELTHARERLELTARFQNDIQQSEERLSAELQKARAEHAGSLQEIERLTATLQEQKLQIEGQGAQIEEQRSQIEELQRSISYRILRRLRGRK